MNENQKELFGEGYNMTPVDTARAVGFVGGTNSDGILALRLHAGHGAPAPS